MTTSISTLARSSVFPSYYTCIPNRSRSPSGATCVSDSKWESTTRHTESPEVTKLHNQKEDDGEREQRQ